MADTVHKQGRKWIEAIAASASENRDVEQQRSEANCQYRQRYNITGKYPQGKKCEDRLVFYSFHFDGVYTSFWGSGTTVEVVSLQIMNTPESNRADRRFCCFVGVFRRE